MVFFEAFLVALATYSSIPVPQFEWNERNMKYAICFFPAVGILCGGALLIWYALSVRLAVSGVLFAAVAVCLPLLITGGIHMDGFMDTMDALASHQPRERKLKILKDSHCGAFAVIYCVVYMVLSFGLLYELYTRREIAALCPAFILSRSLSAFCAVTMPNARKAGMLCAYTENAEKTKAAAAAILIALLSCGGMAAISPTSGLAAAVCSLMTMLFYRRMTMKQFGGVTGDTSGFFLQLCELAVLFGAWAGGLLK